LRDAPWHLWTSQLAGVLSIELRKNLLRRRSVWLYIVAFFPVFVFWPMRCTAWVTRVTLTEIRS